MASSLVHVRTYSSFTRVEGFSEFPVRIAKVAPLRCSSADKWDGNVSVTDERRRKDAAAPKPDSNQKTLGKSEQDEENKVTGKSRGEIFLERALGTSTDSNSTARAQVLPEVTRNARKERKQKKEKLAAFVTRRDEPCCYGCGAILQCSVPEAPGFLSLSTFEVVCIMSCYYF